jgi:cytoskeleton protein RodZ
MGKLGDTLRERRNALHITIEQAEEHTKLRARLLVALEAGDYERLPDPGYVRGYISSYARYLELDPLPLLAMYKAETGITHTAKLDLPQAGTAVAPSGQQHALPFKSGIAAVVVIGVLSLSVWVISSLVSGPEPTPPPPVAPISDVQASEAETPTAKPSTPGGSTEQPAVDSGDDAETGEEELVPFTLGVRVASDGASWVRVVVDGKRAYEGTLAGGQSKTFEVAREATVRVGKRESVTLTRDGEPIDVRGSGDVPTVTLKAEPVR